MECAPKAYFGAADWPQGAFQPGIHATMTPMTMVFGREKSFRLGESSFPIHEDFSLGLTNRTKYDYDNLGRQVAEKRYDATGLAGNWLMNGTSDNKIFNSATNTWDGELGGYSLPVVSNGAITFDGLSQQNGTSQRVAVPVADDSPLDVYGADRDMTISARVLIAGFPPTGGKCVIVSKRGATDDDFYQYGLSILPSQAICFQTKDGSISTTRLLTLDNQWHDIVATYKANGANSSVHIYVDGELWASSDTFPQITHQAGTDLIIGDSRCNNGTCWVPFNGQIDDLRIYDRELSAEEIVAMPTTSTDYDAVGNVVAVTDPLSHVIQYDYDNLGRQVAEKRYDATGLAGNWLMNGTSDNKIFNSATNTWDGELGGYSLPVVSNGAITFDGLSQQNGTSQRVAVPVADDSPLDVYGADRDMTISARVLIAGFPPTGGKCVIVSKRGATDDDFYQYGLSILPSQAICFQTKDGSISTTRLLTLDNQWHDIVATYKANGANSSVHIYVDGELWASSDTFPQITHQAGTDLIIGDSRCNNGTCWVPFNGQIDDLRIYDRELSAEEIVAMPDHQHRLRRCRKCCRRHRSAQSCHPI